MNIFMPYEDISNSVQALDDRRLIKQILECKQLLDIALGNTQAWSKHPVAVYYKNYPQFLASYGVMCCIEYEMRFKKKHTYADYLTNLTLKLPKDKDVRYIYAQGSITSENCIRTTTNTEELFRKRLLDKWDNDTAKGRKPKWTNRLMPWFYTNRIIDDEVKTVC